MPRQLSPDADLPNGAGAAAILAAGAGCFALGVFALAADALPAIKNALIIWPPTGALSGVSTAAVAVWLGVWLVLSRLWGKRDVKLLAVNSAAFALLASAL